MGGYQIVLKTQLKSDHSTYMSLFQEALVSVPTSVMLLLIYKCLDVGTFQNSTHSHSRWPGSSDGIATVQGSNPSGGEIFCTCLGWPWGPPSLLYNGYQVFPRGRKWSGYDADPSPPSWFLKRVKCTYLSFPLVGFLLSSLQCKSSSLHIKYVLILKKIVPFVLLSSSIGVLTFTISDFGGLSTTTCLTNCCFNTILVTLTCLPS
jgi:hypothetical protein